VTNSISSTDNKKVCTDKCVNAVCGQYTCLTMYDNISEGNDNLSVVFLHNLKALFDYYSGGNNNNNNNNNYYYINGNDNVNNKHDNYNSNINSLFKHKNNIQPRGIDYTNLNKAMNINKTNHVVYNNDIVVEYNDHPNTDNTSQSSFPPEDDSNKKINIGILVDDDYIYKQMDSSNNYEISVENYTYKFIQNGDSLNQQNLSEPNEVDNNIFTSDICSELGKIELWVNLGYGLEGGILFIFTLIIIKIIHYKKLTVSDNTYDDGSEIGSLYSLSSERNESLPSVVNCPPVIII